MLDLVIGVKGSLVEGELVEIRSGPAVLVLGRGSGSSVCKRRGILGEGRGRRVRSGRGGEVNAGARRQGLVGEVGVCGRFKGLATIRDAEVPVGGWGREFGGRRGVRQGVVGEGVLVGARGPVAGGAVKGSGGVCRGLGGEGG